MALAVVRASSRYAVVNSGPLTGYPLTMSTWVRPTSGTNAMTAFGLGVASANTYVALAVNPTGRSFDGFVENQATAFGPGAGSFTNGVMGHLAGTMTGTTGQCFVNGVAGTPASVGGTFTPVRTTIGCVIANGSTISFFDGDIGECAIWNVVLTPDEIKALSRGYAPWLIRPQNLVFYAPAQEAASPTRDFKGGLSLTWTNSPVKAAAHPLVIQPRSANVPLFPQSLFGFFPLDRFDRSNGFGLGPDWTDDTIVQGSQQFNIASNRAACSNGPYAEEHYDVVVPGVDVGESHVVATLPNGSSWSLGGNCRVQSASTSGADCYRWQQDSTNTMTLVRVVDTAEMVLTSVSHTMVAGDRIAVVPFGSGATVNVTIFRERAGVRTQLLTYDDTSASRITAAGYIGMWAYNGSGSSIGAVFEDFGSASYIAPVVTPGWVTIDDFEGRGDEIPMGFPWIEGVYVDVTPFELIGGALYGPGGALSMAYADAFPENLAVRSIMRTGEELDTADGRSGANINVQLRGSGSLYPSDAQCYFGDVVYDGSVISAYIAKYDNDDIPSNGGFTVLESGMLISPPAWVGGVEFRAVDDILTLAVMTAPGVWEDIVTTFESSIVGAGAVAIGRTGGNGSDDYWYGIESVEWMDLTAGGGGTDVDATSSLSGGGSLSETAQKRASVVSSSSGGGAASEAVQKTMASASSLSGGGAVSGTGGRQASATSSLSGGGDVQETVGKAAQQATALAGGGGPTAVGSKAASITSALSGGGVVAEAAQKAVATASALSGGGTTDETGAKAASVASALSGGGDVLSVGSAAGTFVSALSGGGQPAEAAQKLASSITSLTGGGQSFASSRKESASASSLSGGGQADDVGAKAAQAASALSGGGSPGAVGAALPGVSSALSGGGSLAEAVTRTAETASSLGGGGQPVATGSVAGQIQSSLTGGGSGPTSATKAVSWASSLSGGGDAPTQASKRSDGLSSLSGGGQGQEAATRAVTATSSLSGGGTTATVGNLAGSVSSSLSGGGQPPTVTTKSVGAATSVSGGGQPGATGGRQVDVTTTVTGGGGLQSLTGVPQRSGTTSLSGGGIVASSTLRTAVIASSLTGGGLPSAKARKPFLWGPLPGGGASSGGGGQGRAHSDGLTGRAS